MNQEKIYKPSEVAKMVGVTKATVINHIKNGTLKGYKVFNRWKIKESELKEFLKSINF